MRVLGLSAFHRDSAAALVVDGRAVAAAREGWFTRREHEGGFPRRAARDCLRRAGLRADELDAVVYERKPLLEFERVLVSQLRAFPRSGRSFARSMFLWLGDRLWMQNRIASELDIPFERVHFIDHHRALAANAWLESPFDEAALLTSDEGGEWTSTSLGRAGPGGMEVLGEIHFPHSLALAAAAVTQLIGMEPGRDGARVEALAAEGTPRYLRELEALVPESGDGAFSVDAAAFRFAFDDEHLVAPGLESALGPARQPGAAPGEREADVAASLQALLERRVLGLARELSRRTGSSSLCFSGSLARNRRLVARLAEEGPFAALFVPPSPDEAGAALGAALLVSAALGREPVRAGPACFPGPEAVASSAAGEHEEQRLDGPAAVRSELARRLSRGECVAWVRGAMELGPQSLGHRSVLRSAAGEDARRRLLAAVGRDEAGREASVLLPAERAAELVELPPAGAHALRMGWLAPRARPLLARLAPSAVAADGRVPAQAVEAAADPELHALLLEHGAGAGEPLLLHVPLAPRGGAPVLGESDALDAWRRSAIDALIVADRLHAAG